MKGPGRGKETKGRYAISIKGALSRVCPRCGAAIGWKCLRTNKGASGRLVDPHPERVRGE